MTEGYDPDLIARKLKGTSPVISYVGATLKKRDGIQFFYFATKRLMTTEDMVSICRDMAEVIRRDIPERSDGWSCAICPGNAPLQPMGVYYLGWAGRADEWYLKEGEERKATDHADWLAFRNRVRIAVAALGTEERTGEVGDFGMSDNERGGEKGPLRLTLFVNNPEFLTKELIATIQVVLRDGRSGEVVKLFLAFGEPFDSLWEGLEVRSDSVVERWDRQKAEQLLGDRLKIPRYTREDS